MDEMSERRLRQQAIRRLQHGESMSRTARAVQRTREWVRKWWYRFLQSGRAGLKSQSRCPQHLSQRYSARVRRLVVRARRHLLRARIGFHGPRAIQSKLRQWRVQPVPSESTILRVLHAEGCLPSVAPQCVRAPYYPHPHPTRHFRLHAMDWTAHFLTGGALVYAFNTIDYTTRDLCSQAFGDKSLMTVCTYALGVWAGHLGLPDGLQIDNDAVFAGGYRGRRVIGTFVRLCLYVGIEPIFTPFYEPQCNELVEMINNLWRGAFWEHYRFRSLAHVQRTNSAFERWYRDEYEPPTLAGQTPSQQSRDIPVVRLTAAQVCSLPDPLPITAGRIHFLRLVDAQGDIVILNERWHVGPRWAGKYVWATIWTAPQRLEVYYRRSPHHAPRLLKTWDYPLNASVVPLRSDFRRRPRRRKMPTML